jgi:hypothetical protein
MIRAKTNLAFLENVKKETEHILEIVAAFNTDIQAYTVFLRWTDQAKR